MAPRLPLRILPPFGYPGYHGLSLGRCQAAISMSCHYPYRCVQPLPRWRYCSFSGDRVNGIALCSTHRRMVEERGIIRLLPRLKVWSPQVKREVT